MRDEPTGLASVDALESIERPTLDDYVVAASEYVRRHRDRNASQKKKAQIRLSAGLARVLVRELKAQFKGMEPLAGERDVSGALRVAKADVSEVHPLDGLRLAVELKPVNLAVGRAIWNRFGDIRTFAVNLHLKFPFAVVGGVLTVPTYELPQSSDPVPKSTKHLISRAVDRLSRAGGRRTEGDAAHLLEGVAVVVYDPESASIDAVLPPAGSGLRWDEFIQALVTAYQARFE